MTKEKKSELKEKQFEKMIEVQKKIKKYSKSGEPGWKEIETNPSIVLTAQDIILNPFQYSLDYKDHWAE